MYDRDYLKWAIPEPSVDATDPEGLLEGDEREAWNSGYECVLRVIRDEFMPDAAELTEPQVTEAVLIANNAWNKYCEYQGGVDKTIEWVRYRMAA